LIWIVKVLPKKPRKNVTWNTDCEFQSRALIDGDNVTFTKVRDFFWRTTRDRDENWDDDITVNANEIKDVWFVVDHFHKIHGLAHTFLTIEFNDGKCLSFSYEARRIKGQRYHPWDGMWRNYELFLLVGYESDLLGLRTNARGNKDYMFRAITPPGKEKQLLLGLAKNMNSLIDDPIWYHSLLTTCNTSIVKLVNKVTPGRIPFFLRNFLPGYTPKVAFKLALVEDMGGYEKTLELARIDQKAMLWDGEGDYSEMIRSHLPAPKNK
tara:strand:+ start:317 stop:1114 length:798 start_codon:yes stop_codon:yes gene_type:complete